MQNAEPLAPAASGEFGQPFGGVEPREGWPVKPQSEGVGVRPDDGGALLPPNLARRVWEELRRRHQILNNATRSPANQVLTLAAVSQDVVLFFDDWLWTYDPRLPTLPGKMPASIPFKTRPHQREYLRWLEQRETRAEDGLVEKSRDEGFSFLTLGFMLHRWLTVDGWAGSVGSRKEALVDTIGDPSSLVEKIRFMYRMLPPWMLQAFAPGFNPKVHDGFMKLINPGNGATIRGEAGDNMGRGGRASFYMIDEWAFVDRPDAVEAATSQTARTRIKGSTPNGVGNRFYKDRFSGRIPVFTFSWRDNPDKNWHVPQWNPALNDGAGGWDRLYPWYENEKARLDDVTLAQEVDLDYTASVTGVVIPAKWVQAAIKMHPTLLAETRRGAGRVAGLDVSEGTEQGDDTVYTSRMGSVMLAQRIIDLPPGPDAAEADQFARGDGVGLLIYDRLGVGSHITGTLKANEDELPYLVEGVSNGANATDAMFEDSPEVPGHERFKNWAAQAWWALRLRFWRTWQRHEGKAHYPADECIGLLDIADLVAQLSQPVYTKDSKGKILVLKHGKKGDAGSSPDRAESLLYAYCDPGTSIDILMPGSTMQTGQGIPNG